MTVFVKRYPEKGEFPDKDDVYVVRTVSGITRIAAYIGDKASFASGLLGNDIKNENIDWWLEEIELPKGANLILNLLKQK